MHVEPRSVDVDSIDGTAIYTGELGGVFSPQVGFQLKCTAASHTQLASSEVTIALPVKNYNELIITNSTVPRILIVVLVPEAITEWITQDEEQFRMRRCAYWASLEGREQTQNRWTKTVKIPKTQAFTVDQLRQLLSDIAAANAV